MRAIIIAILVVILLGLGFGAGSFWLYRTPRDYAETTMVIPPHTGVRATLGMLHEAGLVPGSVWMALPLYANHDYASLKAGEYLFTTGMTPAAIIQKIARGDVVIHKITIPEGWNQWQVRAAFTAEPLLTGEVPAIAEGSIFPDTMRFQRGQTRASVIEQMQKRRNEMLAREWAVRAPEVPLTSPEQAMIVASMIEKETGVPEERAMVASVFYNRLRLGMKLQSDPTVVYGIEWAQNGLPMGRALTTADLAADTVYNSYTREGLPPTPICNPGQAALVAALHPATSEALYFVATGHGGHNFSASLAQHESNVVTYKKTKHR